MWTRGILILAVYFVSSNVGASDVPSHAARGRPAKVQPTAYLASEDAEPLPTPTPQEMSYAADEPPPGSSRWHALDGPSYGPNPSGCVRCKGPWGRCWDWLFPPCNLVPHVPYPPTCHGWYHFRPYNVCQLPELQEAVHGWGGDPRNPYSNDLFQRVYPRKTIGPAATDK